MKTESIIKLVTVFAVAASVVAPSVVFASPMSDHSVQNNSVDLNGTKMIFCSLKQFSGKGGTVCYNFSAYTTSSTSEYVIYILTVHITADSNNGYWVAGNKPNNGQWSGKASFTNPEWDIVPIGAGVPPTVAEFNQFSPSNPMYEDSAGTITASISAGAAETVFDASLSLTYPVNFSYNVPIVPVFFYEPTSLTANNATFEFSNDLANTGQHPLTTSFTTAVSVRGSGNFDYVTLTVGGDFAHHGGWLNLFTDYSWVTSSQCYQIQT